MDCNSYSYAPHMLDGERDNRIAHYDNDDMSAEITPSSRGNVGAWERGWTVYAGSYDGQLDVCEFFVSFDRALDLYKHIVREYKHTPPGGELNRYIRQLLKQDRRRSA